MKDSSGFRESFDVVCFGRVTEDMVLSGNIFSPICSHGSCYEHIALGSKLKVDNLETFFGGNALNAATTFARQKLIVGLCTQVGRDAASQGALQDMGTEGISLGLTLQVDGFKIPRSVNIVAPSGERAVLAYRGSSLEPSLMAKALEGAASTWCYVSSLNSYEALSTAVNWAKSNGVKIAFNPGSQELEDPQNTQEIVREVDVLILNLEEARLFIPKATGPKLGAKELAEMGLEIADVCVVTDGQNGSWAASRKEPQGEVIQTSVDSKAKVVDRTGAGDAFASGLVSGLVTGLSLEESLELGAMNATSVVAAIGSRNGILRA